MRRITPEEVKAAYEKTGLKPFRGSYMRTGTGEACGIGVKAFAESGEKWWDWVDRHTRDNKAYHYGFVGGFDGSGLGPNKEDDPADYELGRLDGEAAAAAVFQET
jgi:hypothetical protein